jgi:hypothetical protein
MHNRGRVSSATLCVFLALMSLFMPPLLPLATAATATGRFEVYCDGVGIFLTKIDGAPAQGKLVLFSRVDFPPGTMGDRYFGQGRWSDIFILPDGCVPDGKCESIAGGRVWIDAPDGQDTPPQQISGKYEINFNGKLLKGTFLSRKRIRKRPLRLCM